jgi:phospho-N-acetylmuramoyl-pentapeptide-transferase
LLLILLTWLQKAYGVKLPSVFYYSSVRMMLAALTSLLITIFLGPRCIKLLYQLKIGQKIRSEKEVPFLAQLHGKKKDTPTMGGILILFAVTVSWFLFSDLHTIFPWILILFTVGLASIGFIDDYLKLKKNNSKGLSAKKKLFFQGILSVVLSSYLLLPFFSQWIETHLGFAPPLAKNPMHMAEILPSASFMTAIFIPFCKEPIVYLPIIVSFLFTFIVIVGSSNAVNLTDGLDGLAIGCLIMTGGALGVIAFLSNHIEIASYLNIFYLEGSGEIAIFLFALVGAGLGFLWYNGHPAQIFMGDTGSLSLGGILGVSAVLLRREILFAIIGGIFLAEALSVIIQVFSYKYRGKKRVFLCAPLHHHFEYKGWPETKVVLRFWIISLFLAIIGMATLKFQ